MKSPAAVEFLYSIHQGYDANDDWIPAHIVKFRITKKTPKRIYYVRRDWTTQPEIRFVDRQKIEADGEVYSHSRHWSEPDFHLYLTEPEVPQYTKPNLGQLKAEMAAAHPDRGGSDEEFITARDRYQRARLTGAES